MKHIIDIMSENKYFKCNVEGQNTFDDIKSTIAQALMLVILDFKKDFIFYWYVSEHILSNILTQKNDEGEEAPIASTPLKKHELKCSLIEK